MEIKPSNIMRRSIYSFLQNYENLTSTGAFLAFPFSFAILLSQIIVPAYSPTLFPTIYDRLRTLFQAAGFPPTSEFFTLLSFKLSQTISQSIFTLPFTLTFLLLAKSYVILLSLNQQKPASVFAIFGALFHTNLWTSALAISASATAFALLFLSFNFLDGLGLSTPTTLLFLSIFGAVLYSIILANTFVVCNLALVLSGLEQSGGYLSILRSCVMIRGRASAALSLAVPLNLGLAGLEALFHFRIVRRYYTGGEREDPLDFCPFMALEGMLIAYLYSILIVLDTVVTCNFYKSCKANSSSSGIDQGDEEFVFRIEIGGEDLVNGGYSSLKVDDH